MLVGVISSLGGRKKAEEDDLLDTRNDNNNTFTDNTRSNQLGLGAAATDEELNMRSSDAFVVKSKTCI